jgi:hypothetical protein
MHTREGVDSPLVISVLIPIQPDLILPFIAEDGARNRARYWVPKQTSRTGYLWGGLTPLLQGGQIDLLACFSGNFLERWGQFLWYQALLRLLQNRDILPEDHHLGEL